jgi:hypothetical protein
LPLSAARHPATIPFILFKPLPLIFFPALLPIAVFWKRSLEPL